MNTPVIANIVVTIAAIMSAAFAIYWHQRYTRFKAGAALRCRVREIAGEVVASPRANPQTKVFAVLLKTLISSPLVLRRLARVAQSVAPAGRGGHLDVTDEFREQMDEALRLTTYATALEDWRTAPTVMRILRGDELASGAQSARQGGKAKMEVKAVRFIILKEIRQVSPDSMRDIVAPRKVAAC